MQSSEQRIDVGCGVRAAGMLSRKRICGSFLSCWCLFCLGAQNSPVWTSLLQRICVAQMAATHCCASPLEHREQSSALLTAGAWHSCFMLCSSVMIWLEFRDVLCTVAGFSLQHFLRRCKTSKVTLMHGFKYGESWAQSHWSQKFQIYKDGSCEKKCLF